MRLRNYLNESFKKKGELAGKTPQEFDKAFKNFMKNAQKVINDYTKKAYSNLNPDYLDYDEGPRYIKVFRRSGTVKGSKDLYMKDSKSAWAFIDKGTGDIFKPAGWKAPAKHARGNIFDKNSGMKAITQMGSIVYMR